MATKKQLNPGLKLVLDIGPLILFFVANSKYGIYVATGAFMAAILVALAVSYAMTRHLAIMPIVTAVIVVIFGGLTPLLGMVFDSVFQLREEGWRKLTWRWAIFFFVLAILNEIVWRTQTTDFWVSFKLFGVAPLTFLFAALQVPLLNKYSIGKKN